MSLNSRHKATQIKRQRKASIGREFKSLSVREKKVLRQTSLHCLGIVTEKHTIYQNNRQTSLKKKEVKPFQPVQMSIYQSNTYRKDLSWLHFIDEPRVQKRQQVKDQQSCISVYVAYPTILSSKQEHQPRHDNSIP